MYSRYVCVACKTPRIPLEAAQGRMRMLQPESLFTSPHSRYIYISQLNVISNLLLATASTKEKEISWGFGQNYLIVPQTKA